MKFTQPSSSTTTARPPPKNRMQSPGDTAAADDRLRDGTGCYVDHLDQTRPLPRRHASACDGPWSDPHHTTTTASPVSIVLTVYGAEWDADRMLVGVGEYSTF